MYNSTVFDYVTLDTTYTGCSSLVTGMTGLRETERERDDDDDDGDDDEYG